MSFCFYVCFKDEWRELTLNDNHNLSLFSRTGTTVLRVLTLIGLFFAAYAFVLGIFEMLQDFQAEEISKLVVVIYVLVTPFTSIAAVLFTFFVHRAARGEGADFQMVLGYAMMVMAAVDNLIYVSVHNSGDSVSFYILAGLELVCFIICFLYYQGIGNGGITLCASIILMLCMALELEESIRYIFSTELSAFISYYFAQTFLNFLVALEGLLFSVFVKTGISHR